MKKSTGLRAIDIAAVQSRMFTIRNQQVLLDRDVAALYGVETKALNQAVKRNAERFEDGYLFRLNEHEVENWKSQIVTSNLSAGEIAGLKMGLRRAPYAFTERGLYMLATVLNSDRAVRATGDIGQRCRPFAPDELRAFRITRADRGNHGKASSHRLLRAHPHGATWWRVL